MSRPLVLAACACGVLLSASRLSAQTAAAPAGPPAFSAPRPTPSLVVQGEAQQKPEKPSPWLLLPLVSSGPKLGTSFGFLGSYLHYFDPKSQVSMFGLMYEYSTTKSQVGAVFARTSFAEDRQRLEGLFGYAYVRNEYKDYMGTGRTFRTTDRMALGGGRYLFRAKGPWFVGAEGAFGDYSVEGETDLQNKVLKILGLAGFQIGGAGPILKHDSRDNQDMPVRGWYANLNYLANRTRLGSEDDFDTVRLDVKAFVPHGKGHVLAVRGNNQWTHEAPTSAESSLEIRAYKMGQYLGKYMSSIEAEERLRFSKRWGATIFGGAANLYGSGKQLVANDGWYPFAGAGIQFIVKPEDHMLLDFEFAHGNLNNYGIYLKFGYAW
jgi:hypothetical protein